MEPGLPILRLRPATFDDAPIVFGWRNHPAIVALGSQNRSVTWEEHRAWFREAIEGSERRIFIIELNGEPSGSVRFDHKAGIEAEVSIYLLPGHEGKGLGLRALRSACEQVCRSGWAGRIIARILHGNHHSLAAFRKAGFEAAAADDEVDPMHVNLSWSPVATVPHNRITFGLHEEQAVTQAVRSGQWAGGRLVEELEARFASVAGAEHAMAVSSGVSALRLALLGLRIGAGDAVAVPAYSCVALPNAVLACGATPVPVDVERDTWNISPVALRSAMEREPRLRAAIAVHTFGFPADMQGLGSCGVPLIEDCSHGFGNTAMGRQGHIRILSLYATKLIGAGQGGIILTDDSSAAAHIRDASDYVDKPAAAWRLRETMSAFEAALALCQLDRLPELIAQRQRLAARYNASFAPLCLCLPPEHPHRVWYRYVLNVSHPALIISALAEQHIHAAIPITNWLTAAEQVGVPCSDFAYRHLLSLPLFPMLGEMEQDRVIGAIQAATSNV